MPLFSRRRWSLPCCETAIAFLVVFTCLISARLSTAEADDAIREKSLTVLRDALRDEQRFVKVHAAEALILLGHTDEVRATFEREVDESEGKPEYRIGIWRVLARCSNDTTERDAWIGKIRSAFVDVSGPDRNHAAETLGKLGYAAAPDEIAAFQEAARGDDKALAVNACWVLTNTDQANEAALARWLDADDLALRLSAAYALRFRGTINEENRGTLARAASRAAESDAPGNAYIVAAAYVLAPDAESKLNFRRQLSRFAKMNDKDARYEFAAALAGHGDKSDVDELVPLLADEEVDVRVSAANALLSIDRRQTSP